MKSERLPLENLVSQIIDDRRERRQQEEYAATIERIKELRRSAREREIDRLDHELLTSDRIKKPLINSARIIDRIFPGTLLFYVNSSQGDWLKRRMVLIIPYIYGSDTKSRESILFGINRYDHDEPRGLTAVALNKGSIGGKCIIPISEFVSDISGLLATWIDPYRGYARSDSQAWRHPIIDKRPFNPQMTQEWHSNFSNSYPDLWNSRFHPSVMDFD